MSSFAGTSRLIRHALRRDRFRLGIWVFVLAFLPIATANAFFELTPTEADRQRMVAAAVVNPAFNSVLGPVFGTSIGALTAWRVGTLAAVLAGLMAVLTVVRHTREEEESGRAELLGSTAVGRLALTSAGFLVVVIVGAALTILIAAGLAGLGLPLAGGVAFGTGLGLVTVCFGALAALAAQLPDGAGTARGIGTGVIGAAFLLRAVGDATDLSYLSWLSPIGWFSQLRPFAEERWWVLTLLGGLSVVVLITALGLAASQDVGSGVLPSRKGPAHATPSLRSPLALSLRLQRGGWVGWTIGLGVLALIYGAVANSIGDLVASNPQLAQVFELLGGQQAITDTFFSTVVGILALIASAYGIRTVLVLRGEEDLRRAEPVLATAVSRSRWMLSHLLVALVGSGLMLLVAAAVAGSTYGLIVDDVGDPSRGCSRRRRGTSRPFG